MSSGQRKIDIELKIAQMVRKPGNKSIETRHIHGVHPFVEQFGSLKIKFKVKMEVKFNVKVKVRANVKLILKSKLKVEKLQKFKFFTHQNQKSKFFCKVEFWNKKVTFRTLCSLVAYKKL